MKTLFLAMRRGHSEPLDDRIVRLANCAGLGRGVGLGYRYQGMLMTIMR
jgi:hypothetical protein